MFYYYAIHIWVPDSWSDFGQSKLRKSAETDQLFDIHMWMSYTSMYVIPNKENEKNAFLAEVSARVGGGLV